MHTHDIYIHRDTHRDIYTLHTERHMHLYTQRHRHRYKHRDMEMYVHACTDTYAQHSYTQPILT